MDWTVPPPPPPADDVAHGPDVHELVVPAEEQDEHHTWINLDRGVMNIVLPPERFGSAWDPEPRSQENE